MTTPKFYDGRLIEMANRQEVLSIAMRFGFNAFVPLIDQGIDFILHRETDGRLLKVQLKSRWTIQRKYVGRDLYMAFPFDGTWCIAAHDAMIAWIEGSQLAESESWRVGGSYSASKPPKFLRSKLEKCAVEAVLKEGP
jgi:hypothetical protein